MTFPAAVKRFGLEKTLTTCAEVNTDFSAALVQSISGPLALLLSFD